MSQSTTPISPRVGGIQAGRPWTEGKPGSAVTTPRTPMCFHPDDYDKLMKIYKTAVTGLDAKYKGFGDTEYPLKSFGLDVQKHLEECGMDGVFNLVNAKGDVYNVITQHAPFTLDNIKIQTTVMSGPYDIQNLDWSEHFLMNSMEPKFQCQLAKYTTSTMNGLVLWKLAMLESQSDSIHALITLVQELQNVTLKSYPSENVKQCTTEIFDKSSQLNMAGSLPSNIGMTICEILSEGLLGRLSHPVMMK